MQKPCKFIFFSPYSIKICDNKQSRKLALEAIKECIDVANAAGVKIEPIQGKDVVKLMDYKGFFKKQISLFLLPIAMKKHRNIRSSMLRDIERGKKTEVYAINGVVAESGDSVNVETPINDKIIEIVEQIENNKLKPCIDNLSLFEQ